jgi:hypothetical protein
MRPSTYVHTFTSRRVMSCGRDSARYPLFLTSSRARGARRTPDRSRPSSSRRRPSTISMALKIEQRGGVLEPHRDWLAIDLVFRQGQPGIPRSFLALRSALPSGRVPAGIALVIAVGGAVGVWGLRASGAILRLRNRGSAMEIESRGHPPHRCSRRTRAQCGALPRSGSDARRKDHGSLRALLRGSDSELINRTDVRKEISSTAKQASQVLRLPKLHFCRYCWVRVERRPARPCSSIECCQERNSSTVSV